MDYEFGELYQNIQPQYVTSFVVGRFQPFHNGHKDLIEKALERSVEVIVFIGSVQESRTNKNPYTFEERRAMILNVFPERVKVVPLKDSPTNEQWIETIKQTLVDMNCNLSTVKFVCCNKDAATEYSNALLSDFDTEVIQQPVTLNATDIRKQLFEENIPPLELVNVPIQVRVILNYLSLKIKSATLKYNIN